MRRSKRFTFGRVCIALLYIGALLYINGCCKRQIVPPIDDRPPVAHAEAPRPLVVTPPVQSTTPEPAAILDPLAAVVRFGFDSDAISADGMKTIEYVVAQAAGRRLRLVGGACEIGSADYNYDLGMRRALAAREAISIAGVPRDSIHVVSVGEMQPITLDKARLALNRRCEIYAE